MTNLRMFDKSLQISWIKRLKDQNDGWEFFPRYFNIHKIEIFGDIYPTTLANKINNPFWLDVSQACATFQSTIYNENNKAYNIPLWHNSGITLSFKKQWFDKGYTKISDIMNIEGQILTRDEMMDRGLNLNFLDYEKLRFDISNLNIKHGRNDMNGPYIPLTLTKIGYNGKGCSNTYKYLMDFDFNILLVIQNKWENILDEEINLTIIEKSFRNIQEMKEGAFVRYLQFKMLHNRIITNKKLYDMGISDTNNCPYCQEPDETIEHAFLTCETVKIFWNEVEQWLLRNIGVNIKISNIEKIMGTSSTDDIIDKTILATKRVIYRNRQEGKPYSIIEVKARLRTQMLMEEYHAMIEGSEVKYLKTWELIYGIIY